MLISTVASNQVPNDFSNVVMDCVRAINIDLKCTYNSLHPLKTSTEMELKIAVQANTIEMFYLSAEGILLKDDDELKYKAK